MADPCPRGGEIIDYALGLCSCGECAPVGDLRRKPAIKLWACPSPDCEGVVLNPDYRTVCPICDVPREIPHA